MFSDSLQPQCGVSQYNQSIPVPAVKHFYSYKASFVQSYYHIQVKDFAGEIIRMSLLAHWDYVSSVLPDTVKLLAPKWYQFTVLVSTHFFRILLEFLLISKLIYRRCSLNIVSVIPTANKHSF
jgi:hypothetical protein